MNTTPDIKEIQDAINAAETAQNWPEVDRLFKILTPMVTRDADFVARHALAVLNMDDKPRAATLSRKAVRMDPGNASHRLQLGKVYFAQGRHKEAETVFRSVLEITPDNPEAMRRLAQTIQTKKDCREEAEKLLDRAAELEPDNVALWQQLGAIYGNDPERYEQAEYAFHRALEINPNLPSAYHNIGLLKRFQGNLDDAESHLRKACELDPENTTFAFSLGSCLMFKEEMEESLEWFRKSATLDDKNTAAKIYTAFALFLLGDMREGWIEYEKRFKLDELKDLNYARPRWNGEAMDGKTLLLLREQGFGDSLQFVRYAEKVAERGGNVILLSQKPLLRLFQSVRNVSAVLYAIPAPKNFHRYCPLMSLPYIFETDEDTIPADVPYLSPVDEDVEAWRERLSAYPGLKVGIAWRGNPGHTNDRFRSSSLQEFSRLFSIPGISFFSMVLERPEFETELPDGLIDITDGFGDFADTAAAMKNLDLVISVDTSVCHLAGAIGQPVWTMLARGPDFRWGLNGTTTPWYPTMKLYRQTVLGDWPEVLDRIAEDLRTMAESNKG